MKLLFIWKVAGIEKKLLEVRFDETKTELFTKKLADKWWFVLYTYYDCFTYTYTYY